MSQPLVGGAQYVRANQLERAFPYVSAYAFDQRRLTVVIGEGSDDHLHAQFGAPREHRPLCARSLHPSHLNLFSAEEALPGDLRAWVRASREFHIFSTENPTAAAGEDVFVFTRHDAGYAVILGRALDFATICLPIDGSHSATTVHNVAFEFFTSLGQLELLGCQSFLR